MSLSFAQNKDGMARIARDKSLAGLMSIVKNWALDRSVERQINEFGLRIASDLEYAGSGGVLIVARFEKVQTESGTYRRLIGDHVNYIGIGATDCDAEISDLSKSKLESGITPGSIFDAEHSTAYWFYKTEGTFAVSEKPISWLRAEVINELVSRKRQSYDWRLARSAELTRLADIVARRSDKAELHLAIAPLLQSRTGALAKQAEINSALREALELARKAAEQEEALKAIGFLSNYASFVSQFAASPEQSNASPMTRQEAAARLEEIQKEANAKAAQLATELQDANDTTLKFDLRLEMRLHEGTIPTDNIPPIQAPLDKGPLE
jgi:hypothetical protein